MRSQAGCASCFAVSSFCLHVSPFNRCTTVSLVAIMVATRCKQSKGVRPTLSLIMLGSWNAFPAMLTSRLIALLFRLTITLRDAATIAMGETPHGNDHRRRRTAKLPHNAPLQSPQLSQCWCFLSCSSSPTALRSLTKKVFVGLDTHQGSPQYLFLATHQGAI